MESQRIDVTLLRSLYPNPRPAEPSATCGYCVGGTLLAFRDGISAQMADDGQRAEGRKHYFPLAPELKEILVEANPELSAENAARYADFITRCNDRRRYSVAWSFLKEALDQVADTTASACGRAHTNQTATAR